MVAVKKMKNIFSEIHFKITPAVNSEFNMETNPRSMNRSPVAIISRMKDELVIGSEPDRELKDLPGIIEFTNVFGAVV